MANNLMVKPGTKVRFKDYDPDANNGWEKDDPRCQSKLSSDLQTMAALQEMLFAENKQSLLIVLQAMDAGGKDGTIKHVLTGLNPQTCDVVSFKVPSAEELAHDFLWRIHKYTPGRGLITVFNRSHYEDVLVVRVHNLVPPKVWKARYDRINEFEYLLGEKGTRVIKFFLYISKEEQRQRLQERLDDPQKHWKISDADVPERELWDDYMKAYEEALSRCSTSHAPWYVIPANRKWYRNMMVAEIIAKTLKDMNPKWPPPQVDLSKIVIK